MRAVVVVAGLLVLLGVGIPSRAQDGPPPVDTVIVYYEDEHPNWIAEYVDGLGVCFERFVALNPDLDLNNVPYGTRLIVPKNEPCYRRTDRVGGIGRLKYYENGQWLDEPYYADVHLYYRYNALTVEAVAQHFNVCIDDLLKQNWLLQHYPVSRLMSWRLILDVFLPTVLIPCDTYISLPYAIHENTIIEVTNANRHPLFFVENFNICAESLIGQEWVTYRGIYSDDASIRQVRVATGLPLCYNDVGQRLIFFDEAGKRLVRPYYSHLPVYRVLPGETLDDIVARTDACPVHLLRLNNFPRLPITRGGIELFIPDKRPCPSDISVFQTMLEEPYHFAQLRGASLQLDICMEDLEQLNPHLAQSPERYWGGNKTENLRAIWVLLRSDNKSCYQRLIAQQGESIYGIERRLNICHEAFIREPNSESNWRIKAEQEVIRYRRDSQPCYNSAGQRLQYQPFFEVVLAGRRFADPYMAVRQQDTEYADMQVHTFETGDTVYGISQHYNVCVHDLLAVNPSLKIWTPEGYPTFIPDTRPCYDEATGMPLIYEDENGVPLNEPRVGDKLIYYGTEAFGHVSYYYNVCQNRIEEANAAKLAGEAHYLGWIIPRDRPPCYDEDGYAVDYAVKRHEDSGGIVHTVQMGETLIGIANRYDKSLFWIAAANDLRSTDMIWTEQRLIIPGGVTTRDVKLISAALIGLAAVAGVWLWRRR
jgi:LysM repeat protein